MQVNFVPPILNTLQFQSPLINVCGGYVFAGYPNNIQFEVGNQPTAPLTSTVPVAMAYLNLNVFMVDGTNLADLNLSTMAMQPYSTSNPVLFASTAGVISLVSTNTTSTFTSGQEVYIYGITGGANQLLFNGIWTIAVASSTTFTFTGGPSTVTNTTAGEVSTAHVTNIIGTPPTNCTLACNWRGRLVLAGSQGSPQNFYMARVGNPWDWNYAATDPAAAVAGNLSESGQIGEPITCLIPYTDDYMIIGCSNSIWMLEGDPADGGTIVRVSDKMGIVGANAWTTDPTGTLYFIATGGLYTVIPMWEFYRPPQMISGESWNQYFAGLSWGSTQFSMAWDCDLHYLHIFTTPANGTAGLHLIFDERNGGLWPTQFPSTVGPTCAALYTADASSTGRCIVLGGQDGYIRGYSASTLNDDGSTISASLTFGPYKPFDGDGILAATTVNLGENPLVWPGTSVLETPTGLINSTNTVFYLQHQPSSFVAGFNVYGISTYMGTSTLVGPFTVGPGGAVQGTLGTNYFSTAEPIGAPFSPFSGLLVTYPYISPISVTATVAGGTSAYDVTEGSTARTNEVVMFLDRRQKAFRQRTRGGWFSLTLQNSTLNSMFSFESAELEFAPGGRNRYQR